MKKHLPPAIAAIKSKFEGKPNLGLKSKMRSLRLALHSPHSTINSFGALAATTSAALFLSTACTLTSYTSPQGEHLSRIALGANTSVQSLSLASDTNGLRQVELRGYAGDNSQALGTVTDAAVKAAIQAAK